MELSQDFKSKTSRARLQRQDFKEWLACLLDTRTEFVVVGGYALAHHGCPQFTGYIDVLVRASPENAAKIVGAPEGSCGH